MSISPSSLKEIEVIIFDVDGVLTTSVGENGSFLWLKDIESKLGIEPTHIASFFKENWKKISIGEVDTLTAITEHFHTHGISVPANKFLSYWHKNDSHISNDMLSAAKKLREAGYRTYLGTNQEMYRAKYLWETVGFQRLFEGMFPSCRVGYEKPDPRYFKTVQSAIKQKPSKILFIDDTASHIQAATREGWNAYRHEQFALTNAQVFAPLLAEKKGANPL